VVRKPRGVPGRVSRLVVDGRPIEGNVVPPAPVGARVTVTATIER
jgi:hypothetical protein